MWGGALMAAQTTNAAKKATAAQPTQTKAYVPRRKKFYREKVELYRDWAIGRAHV